MNWGNTELMLLVSKLNTLLDLLRVGFTLIEEAMDEHPRTVLEASRQHPVWTRGNSARRT